MPAPAHAGRTLSRDFKGVRRHKHVAAAQAFSGWVGFGVGLGLGLAVALGVHLYHGGRQLEAGGAEPVPSQAQAPASAVAPEEAAVDAPSANPGGQTLEFYDVLPNQEVEVPEQPAAAPKPARTPLPTGDAVLQAGSFKQATEAERLVAKLALHGVDAKIQRAHVDDETWYRVRIGPIATAEELHVVQAKLREAEVTAAPVTSIEEMPLP